MNERATPKPTSPEPLGGRRGRAASFIRQKSGGREARIGIVPPPEGFDDIAPREKKPDLALKALAHFPKDLVEERTPDELEGPEEKLQRFAREDAGAIEHRVYNEHLQRLQDRREGFLAIIENPSLPTGVKQQARIEAAKLKKQIEPLLPKSEVRERRARAQSDLLKKLEEKRLELLRREVDPNLFYPLRYEATNELRTIEKKVRALKGLQASVRASHAPLGEVIPTATGVRRQILDVDKLRQKPSSVGVARGQETGEKTSKIQDLYGYYMEALRLALDPRALLADRKRAKADLAYHAIKTQRAVELLPTATERQRERKARLEQEIQPFVFELDEQFDWTNPRLLTVYAGIRDCYEAQALLSQERTPERIQGFKKAVLELETKFQTLKRNLGNTNTDEDAAILSSLTPEDAILREALIKNKTLATPPGEPYAFKTIPADVSVPFNKVEPLPLEPYDILTNASRYEDLLALQDDPSAEAKDHARRVKRAEKHLSSLENILTLFKTQATRESDNLIYLRQPQAIGARADYTLDDIDRLRKLKESTPTSVLPVERTEEVAPFASMKLKSESELRQEGAAFRRSQLQTEIQALDVTLRARYGGKNPSEVSEGTAATRTLRDLGTRLWSGAKDLWNKTFSKDYVSNGELEAQYKQKKLELKKLEAASQDPGKEVGISRQIKREHGQGREYLRILSERDGSHEQKMEGVRGYHALQRFLNSCKPTSILDEQLLREIAQDVKRIKQAVVEYEQKLKRLNAELVREIERQKNLPSRGADTERLSLLITAQETAVLREWSLHMEEGSSTNLRHPTPTKEQLQGLKEAHELEYELASNLLLRQATKQREKQEKRIKECYQIAYGEPSSRWAFWRRAA